MNFSIRDGNGMNRILNKEKEKRQQDPNRSIIEFNDEDIGRDFGI